MAAVKKVLTDTTLRCVPYNLGTGTGEGWAGRGVEGGAGWALVGWVGRAGGGGCM